MGEASLGQPVRLDKWLWAVRLFKTRSMAITACTNGRICIQGNPVKPSRSVKEGDVITAVVNGLMRTVRVLKTIHQRVGADRVPEVLEDLTPPEVYQAAQEARALGGFIPRPRGLGRPTKRDRRALAGLQT